MDQESFELVKQIRWIQEADQPSIERRTASPLKSSGARQRVRKDGVLDIGLAAAVGARECDVDGERHIDRPDDNEDRVTKALDVLVVELRDAERRGHLLPAPM